MKQPAPSPPPPPSTTRSRLLWAGGIALLAAGAFAAAEWHGRATRAPLDLPPELSARRVAGVGDAAEAFLVWQGAGANGRRLVVLTGQWGAPRRPPATAADGRSGDPLDASSALYWAARLGIVRAFDVVMPPAAFERRAAEDASHKAFRAEDGAYRHDLHGFRLRHSLPRALEVPSEPVLVLVEPTWFAAGAPGDPVAWLSSLGVRADLVLVALDDPSATDADRKAASAYLRSTRAPRLDLVRTR